MFSRKRKLRHGKLSRRHQSPLRIFTLRLETEHSRRFSIADKHSPRRRKAICVCAKEQIVINICYQLTASCRSVMVRKDIVKHIGVKNASILAALLHLNPKQQKTFISTADEDTIVSICECALNILHRNVQLTDLQKKKLYKYREYLRKLSVRKGGVNKRRKVIQSGGGPFLTALLAPILGGLISRYLNNE